MRCLNRPGRLRGSGLFQCTASDGKIQQGHKGCRKKEHGNRYPDFSFHYSSHDARVFVDCLASCPKLYIIIRFSGHDAALSRETPAS